MKWRSWPLPRIRRTAQTVRGPVARMAPTARAWALVQTQWENSGAKAARMTTISGGRSTGVVSEVEGSCTTVDHRRRPPGSASQLRMERGRTIVRVGQSRVQLSSTIRIQHPGFVAMTRSVTLDAVHRRALIERYRKDPDPEVRFRSHILLLLDDGHTWATVCALLFCSSRTIDRWVKRFHQTGVEGLAGHKPGRPFRFAADWVKVVVAWVTTTAPTAFGFLRSRWCCEAVAILMLELHEVEVSRETVRRWLHRGNLVYRRPRPTLKPKDPGRQAKLDALRGLLAHLPDDETAVFQDEVDLNTNPKIGAMWMVTGQQAEVETPGNNEKRYLSGSIP